VEGDAMIHVLIVDDSPSVRWGLRMQLMLEPDIEVIGEAAGGEETFSLVQRHLSANMRR
jgi:two-component system, NarL family, response regulator LiaR